MQTAQLSFSDVFNRVCDGYGPWQDPLYAQALDELRATSTQTDDNISDALVGLGIPIREALKVPPGSVIKYVNALLTGYATQIHALVSYTYLEMDGAPVTQAACGNMMPTNEGSYSAWLDEDGVWTPGYMSNLRWDNLHRAGASFSIYRDMGGTYTVYVNHFRLYVEFQLPAVLSGRMNGIIPSPLGRPMGLS